jgi:hypothetical protein
VAFNPNEHMSKLSGRDYLEVKWRLVWFRDVFPLGSVATECLYHDDERAFFKATVSSNAIMKDNETLVVDVPGSATGHGSETKRDFPDYIEKAETKAVGRALAMLGYGTQFAPELEEGERIVDSPVQRGSYKQAGGVAPAPAGAPPAEERIRAVRDGTSAVQQVPQQTPPPGNLVTERQRKYLEAVGSEAGWSHNDLHDYALEHFAVPTLTELTRRDASYMIDGLKPPAQGESPKAHYPLEKVARPQANVRPRADPQEANQRAMDVPQEPAWLHDIDQYRA